VKSLRTQHNSYTTSKYATKTGHNYEPTRGIVHEKIPLCKIRPKHTEERHKAFGVRNSKFDPIQKCSESLTQLIECGEGLHGRGEDMSGYGRVAAAAQEEGKVEGCLLPSLDIKVHKFTVL
jgi:hypothetical protein